MQTSTKDFEKDQFRPTVFKSDVIDAVERLITTLAETYDIVPDITYYVSGGGKHPCSICKDDDGYSLLDTIWVETTQETYDSIIYEANNKNVCVLEYVSEDKTNTVSVFTRDDFIPLKIISHNTTGEFIVITFRKTK